MAGHGVIAINPVDLDGAPLVAELSKIAELSRQGRVASIRSDFVIKDQRILTDHFALNIGRVPMTLSGWTGFDGRIDYRINLKGVSDRLPDKARRLLGELNVELETLTSLTLRGTVNQMVVQINGVALDRGVLREPGIKREDREKLRVLGRQFLDQLVR
jgi:AsmA protein